MGEEQLNKLRRTSLRYIDQEIEEITSGKHDQNLLEMKKFCQGLAAMAYRLSVINCIELENILSKITRNVSSRQTLQ